MHDPFLSSPSQFFPSPFDTTRYPCLRQCGLTPFTELIPQPAASAPNKREFKYTYDPHCSSSSALKLAAPFISLAHPISELPSDPPPPASSLYGGP